MPNFVDKTPGNAKGTIMIPLYQPKLRGGGGGWGGVKNHE